MEVENRGVQITTVVEVPDNYTPVIVHGDCKTGADQLAIKSSMTLGWKNRPYPVSNKEWKMMETGIMLT